MEDNITIIIVCVIYSLILLLAGTAHISVLQLIYRFYYKRSVSFVGGILKTSYEIEEILESELKDKSVRDLCRIKIATDGDTELEKGVPLFGIIISAVITISLSKVADFVVKGIIDFGSAAFYFVAVLMETLMFIETIHATLRYNKIKKGVIEHLITQKTKEYKFMKHC